MLLFMDGFDKYGGINNNGTALQALLQAEWQTAATQVQIVAPLSATGQAFFFNASGTGLAKTLPASYGRLIGGFRFAASLVSGNTGLAFTDAGTQQCVITINAGTGTISLRNSNLNGTALGTSTVAVTANSVHQLEYDISFGNAANYQIFLDGVSILSGTGDTTATANNTANGISITQGTSATITIDDLYVFDTSGTTNNAPVLTSPRIETQFPNSDGAVQFAAGAAILGTSVPRTTGSVSPVANQWRVRPFTPTRNMTLNSVCFTCNAASATVNLRPMVYTDSANNPGTLMSAGATVLGAAVGTVTMPLTTPQALTAGTQYWLGLMVDSNPVNLFSQNDGSATDRIGTATFASGAPGTAPSNGGGTATMIWGSVTLATPANFYEVSQQPTQGNNSFLYDASAGHEDLFNFPALTAPLAIYAVAVKAALAKSDAGAKTASVRLKSGATDSAGTGGTALAPGLTPGWMTSHYELNPNGSVAWTKAALDAAQSGVKVET